MADQASTMFINKAQQIARMFLDRIVQDEMLPGSSFGTEAELLAQYQVSRPTLRESLKILESQGIVSMRPGPRGGILVAQPSIDILTHTLSVFLRLNNVPLFEILRARMAIEPALVRDAAVNGTDEQFDEMDASIQRLRTATNEREIYRQNQEFHNVIARAAANPVLEVFWLTIRSLASGEGEHLKFSAKNRAHIADSHLEILEACRRRDPGTAQQLMSDHLGQLDHLLRKRETSDSKIQPQAWAPAQRPAG